MLRKLCKGWVKNENGTTTIEFGLLFIPYLMLTLGIVEIAMMYASATVLEGATGSAARLIRTGQIQKAENIDPETMFRDEICSFATVLVNCEDVDVEVRTMDSYSDYSNMAPQFDEDGNMQSQGFSAGGSNDRVLVRTAYRYSFITPFIGQLLAGSDSSLLFMSTIVLQTEPYEFEG